MLCLCILASWNFLRSIVKQLTYHVCKYINFTNSVVSRFSFNMMMYYLVFGRKFVLGEFRWYWLLVSIYCCVSRVSKPFSFWPESKQALTVHIYIYINISLHFIVWLVYILLLAFKLAVGSNSQTSTRDLQSLTVERLRALLKAKGLSPKGKKASFETRLCLH